MPAALPIPLPELVHLLSAQYGIVATDIAPYVLDHAPVSLTAVVRSRSSETFFLKFKHEIVPGSLAVPALLQARSVSVLAPIPTLSHRLSAQAGSCFLLLYPFLNACPVDYHSLTTAQWRDLGSTLRQIHETPLPSTLLAALPHATFGPWGEHFFSECRETFVHRKQDLWALWQAHQDIVQVFFSVTRQFGQIASLAAPAFHLCHNDFHSDNVLLNPSTGDLTIIDWDNSIWGLRERDLLFIPPENRHAFELGYGPLKEMPEVARYVHADWLLQDLLDCFSRLRSPDLTLQERTWAVHCINRIVPKMRTLLEQC